MFFHFFLQTFFLNNFSFFFTRESCFFIVFFLGGPGLLGAGVLWARCASRFGECSPGIFSLTWGGRGPFGATLGQREDQREGSQSGSHPSPRPPPLDRFVLFVACVFILSFFLLCNFFSLFIICFHVSVFMF